MAMREGRPLLARAELLGQKLRRLVLPIASQLRAGTGYLRTRPSGSCGTSERWGWWAAPSWGVSRLRFTESGLAHFGASDEERSWHRPDGLGNVILYDLPQDRGREHRSALLCDRRMDTVASPLLRTAADGRGCGVPPPYLHAPAYLPLCWAYMMDTQRELVERLEALPEAMQSQSVYPDERFGPPVSR